MTAYNPAEVERRAESLRLMSSDERIPNAWRPQLASAADQLEAARAEIESLEAEYEALNRGKDHPRQIASALAGQLQDAKAALLRVRTERDEARNALREACRMLRGCRSGDNEQITTSTIDALLAVANGDKP